MRAIAASGGAAAAVAQLADHRVGDPQLDRDHALAAGEQLLLLVGGGAGDREHGAGAVDQRDAGVEDLGRGAGDRRQAGARLDRLGERVEAPVACALCRLFGLSLALASARIMAAPAIAGVSYVLNEVG